MNENGLVVQRLLDLLDLVEKTFDPAAIERQLGLLLCNRLEEVADLLRNHYPDSDDESEVGRADGDSAETAPPVLVRVVCREEDRGAETAPPVPVRVVCREEDRGAETAPPVPVRVVCREEDRGAETAPPVPVRVVCKEEDRGADTTTGSPSADVVIVESPQIGRLSSHPIEISPSPPSSPTHPLPPPQSANQQQSYAEIYRETVISPPPEEGPALKRRRLEAQAIVKKVQKPKTYTCACGVSYQDGLEERDFSNRVKREIQAKLPALSTHKRLFHYMVFATLDRLNCSHCSECPNQLDTF